MSLYAAVAQGAQTVQRYQQQWAHIAYTNAEATVNSTSAVDLQQRQLRLIEANQNLQYANDLVNQIIKSIQSLQP